MGRDVIRYKRSRFATRLPKDRLYSQSHLWMMRRPQGLWRVGFTKFATRMLGELVELDFEVGEGEPVETGQVVGWMEGFKAVTDLFSPMSGSFAGANPVLEEDIEAAGRDPYGKGWLFALRGEAGKDAVDARGYAAFLDETIDRMTGRQPRAETGL